MTSLSILLSILHADPARGGAERYTRDLAAALLERGMKVTTAATAFVADWPGHHLLLPPRGWTRAGQYQSFLDLLDSQHGLYDVHHAMLPVRRAHLYHPHAGIAALPKRGGVLERFNRRRNLMGRVERDMLTGPSPALTVALSSYSLSHLRRVYGDAVRATTLLNGVDTGRFDPSLFAADRVNLRRKFGLAADELGVLIVAQDFVRKGVPEAVEAVALTRNPRLKLIVVGKDRPAIALDAARRHGIEGQVILPGMLADPREAYAAADLSLLPTRHDPCPLTTLEALAMGLPVISTVFNGAMDYLLSELPGPTHYSLRPEGAVLPSPDPKLITAALNHYISPNPTKSPATLHSASLAALALRPRLSLKHHMDQLTGLYYAVSESQTAHSAHQSLRVPVNDSSSSMR